MPRTTALNDLHRAAGAKLVDFAGWEMPLHYGSQIEEHHAVRRAAGVFDVSHMRVADLTGAGAEALLRRALANDVRKLGASGRALYSCMLNDAGGIVDDLICYRLGEEAFRLVLNAGTADADVAWLRALAARVASPAELVVRGDLAVLAVQGPLARTRCCAAFPGLELATAALPRFSAAFFRDWFVARTGYTGEDGFEIVLPAVLAPAAWRSLTSAGVRPCGLGARDTLRLEAGMNLYGQDMDERTTPLECGLAWTVDRTSERDFVGRAALARAEPARAQVGLLLADAGVLRAHQRVTTAHGAGEVTSGTFSPTLQRSIALARVPAGARAGDAVTVDIRGRAARATVVPTPFVRDGASRIDPYLLREDAP